MLIKAYSWTVLDNKFAIKKTDKSAFEYRGSTIPRDAYSFFKISDMESGERREITLIMDEEHFPAHFTKETHDLGRIRIFWDSRISKYLQDSFKDYSSFEKDDFPEMVFRSISDSLYEISIISNIVYIEDIVRENPLESYADGKETKVYTTHYERNPINRERAIKHHGRRCFVCDFHFEESYCEIGKGFIEVHHNKPVSSYEGELFIDPVQDMTCLCSNCHRMIHRKRNNTLSVEELQEYYEKAQRNKPNSEKTNYNEPSSP